MNKNVKKMLFASATLSAIGSAGFATKASASQMGDTFGGISQVTNIL